MKNLMSSVVSAIKRAGLRKEVGLHRHRPPALAPIGIVMFQGQSTRDGDISGVWLVF